MASNVINPIRQTTPEEEEALRRLTAPTPAAPASPTLPTAPPGMQVKPVDLGMGLKTNVAKPYEQRGGPVGRPTPQTTPMAKFKEASASTAPPVLPPRADMTAPGQRQLRTPFEQKVATAPIATPTPPRTAASMTFEKPPPGLTHTTPRGEGVPVSQIKPYPVFPGPWERGPGAPQGQPSNPRRYSAKNVPGQPPAPAAPSTPAPNVPYSPVGPTQVQEDIGRPMPPPGMVEVIRPSAAGGFKFTNELGSDVRPVGMDPRTAQEIAGFRNAGLTPPDQLKGVEVLRGAENDATQARAQLAQAAASQTTADAAMMRARVPQQMTQLFLPDPNDPTKGKVGFAYVDPQTGKMAVKELPVVAYRDMDEYTGKIKVSEESNTGAKTEREYFVDKRTNQILGEVPTEQKNKVPPFPADLDPSLGPMWPEAVNEAMKFTDDPGEAAAIAARALRKKAPAQLVE